MAHPTPGVQPTENRLEWILNILDKLIEDVEPIPENYSRWVDNVCVAYIWYIPRGCVTNYKLGQSEESTSMYEDYKKRYTSDTKQHEEGYRKCISVLKNNKAAGRDG